jgi:hypothetical protein
MTQIFKWFLVFVFAFVGLTHISSGQTCTVPQLSIQTYPTGQIVGVYCNAPCQTYRIVEYGPVGFTPGTDSSAGPLGTIVLIPPGVYKDTILGLSPSTYYNIYARKSCASGWSANTTMQSFFCPPNCNLAPQIICDGVNTVPAGSGIGALRVNCNGTLYGPERLFKFTATYSGNHLLIIKKFTYTGNSMAFAFKPLSAGCNNQGWTCIGAGSSLYTSSYLFGPLTAGVTYIILAAPYGGAATPDVDFKIECPGCPDYATTVTATALSPYSALVEWTGYSYAYVEMGPQYFLPGSGQMPGTGAQVKSGDTSTPTVFTGLTEDSFMDAYVRPVCNYPHSLNKVGNTIHIPACPFEDYVGLGQTHPAFSSGPGFNWTYYGWGGCFTPLGGGMETIIKFSPPVTGYYDLQLLNYGTSTTNGLGFKIHDGNCLPSTYSCMTPYYTNINTNYNAKYIQYLEVDSVYDFFVDANTPNQGATLVIQCPIPDSVQARTFINTEIELKWFSYCDSVIIEYGPAGFVPGTGFAPGAGGDTILTVGISNLNITGLPANGHYDIYLRSVCGGTCSPNSIRERINLNTPCLQSVVVNCNGNIGNYWLQAQNGWSTYDCTPQNNNASWDKIVQFVAPDTGMYHLLLLSGGFNCGGTYIYYREEGTACDEVGWNCIGNNYCAPGYFKFGPLSAGKTYYLLFDGPYSTASGTLKTIFLYCAKPCLPPTGLFASNITDTSAVMNASFIDSVGVIYAEYGPTGFTPGTDSLPGSVSSNVIANVNLTDTLWNLSPATTYDVYVRQKCSSEQGFSENRIMTFNTKGSGCNTVGPGWIYSGGDSLCIGSTKVLKAEGIYPSVLVGTTNILWYSDSCFSTPFDTANNVFVSPQVTTTYYAIAYDSCGFTSCVSKTIYVLPVPVVNANVSDTIFCPGDSVIADAGPGFNTYFWSNGATTQIANITYPGNFIVTVSDIAGCYSKDTISVSLLPAPPPEILGDTIGCPPFSTLLDAGIGYSNYLWSTGDTTQIIQTGPIGNYSVSVTHTNGCTANATVEVEEHFPFPVILNAASATDICMGDSVVLIASPGLSDYKWYKNNYLLTGLNTNQCIAYTSGNYRCEIVDTNGCSGISNIIRVRVVCISVGPNHEKQIIESENTVFDCNIWPNPSDNDFKVKFICDSDQMLGLKVYDHFGREVSSVIIQNSYSEFQIQKLPQGLYFVEAKCGVAKRVFKIVQLN